MIRVIPLFIVSFLTVQAFAQPAQTIRGKVTDHASGNPVAYAAVVLLHTPHAAATDSLGHFALPGISTGRYDLKVSSIGYEPSVVGEIAVNSAKETYLEIALKQQVTSLDEVSVKPSLNKQQPLNAMATASARMLSVEEARRYAGGFDDPARLASSFAGVTGNTSENGIIVRGNAPKFLQWKMEGVEIPNPGHFADMQMFGGGTLTALSSQMLGNSDFFTGAFPAEYSNALSGVFDINLRTGSNQRYEHTLQVGMVGIDVSSEGPFRKGGRASYLFNYRYSTLALLAPLLPENAGGMKYQDFSFKLNFPARKNGVFSVWGIALGDKAGAKARTDSTEWEYYNHKQEDKMELYSGAGGMSHQYFLPRDAYIKTTLATTVNRTRWTTQQLDHQLVLRPKSDIHSEYHHFIFSSFLNKKFSARHTNKTGFLATAMRYRMRLHDTPIPAGQVQEIVNASGFSTLLSAYSSSSVQVTDRLLLNLGLSAQWFALSGRHTLEPRVGLRQQLSGSQSLALAYGLHSRLEKLNYYFNNDPATGSAAVNKNLDFTKAHHIVLSYDRGLGEAVRLKIEPYFQYLFSVPVIAGSSFSLLNLQDEWFFTDKLRNTGKGRNYGVDLTVEKYISRGYYYLLTGSVFRSEYRGGDGAWRNTRFNRGYAFNFLAGKEWKAGKQKQHVPGLNVRLTYQGGNRYSPIDPAASRAANEVVYDETHAFARQAEPMLNLHFTGSYRINRRKVSHEIALKVLNLTGQPDFYGHKYNLVSHVADKDIASVTLPNLSYRIDF